MPGAIDAPPPHPRTGAHKLETIGWGNFSLFSIVPAAIRRASTPSARWELSPEVPKPPSPNTHLVPTVPQGASGGIRSAVRISCPSPPRGVHRPPASKKIPRALTISGRNVNPTANATRLGPPEKRPRPPHPPARGRIWGVPGPICERETQTGKPRAKKPCAPFSRARYNFWP